VIVIVLSIQPILAHKRRDVRRASGRVKIARIWCRLQVCRVDETLDSQNHKELLRSYIDDFEPARSH
jgi:hypothetical protein